MDDTATVLAEPRDDDAEILGRMNLPVEAKLAVQIARAEVDQQISTAHAYPRSVSRVARNILTLATLDEEVAKECIYALPRSGKAITGPSIRLAEIVMSQWGNCRVGTRVVEVNKVDKYIEAEGVFHDLETNSAVTKRVQRRIVDSKGRLYNDDMIIVTGNAASSIALRNAIFAAVPRSVWRRAEEAARSVITGDQRTLSARREEVVRAFAAWGVKPARVYEALGVEGIDDITLNHMPTLAGMHAALKNGEATVEELFPTTGAAVPEPQQKPSGKAQGKEAEPGGEASKPVPEPQRPAAPKPAASEPKAAAKAEEPHVQWRAHPSRKTAGGAPTAFITAFKAAVEAGHGLAFADDSYNQQALKASADWPEGFVVADMLAELRGGESADDGEADGGQDDLLDEMG